MLNYWDNMKIPHYTVELRDFWTCAIHQKINILKNGEISYTVLFVGMNKFKL